MDEYHATHDWERDGSVVTTIVEGIAAVGDVSPTETDPLATVVDPDALEALFRGSAGAPALDGNSRIEFEYLGHEIVVTSAGEVTVRPGDTDRGTPEDRFQSSIGRLVRAAETAGVDVAGGWACAAVDDRYDWGVEIYEVARDGK